MCMKTCDSKISFLCRDWLASSQMGHIEDIQYADAVLKQCRSGLKMYWNEGGGKMREVTNMSSLFRTRSHFHSYIGIHRAQRSLTCSVHSTLEEPKVDVSLAIWSLQHFRVHSCPNSHLIIQNRLETMHNAGNSYSPSSPRSQIRLG